MTRRRWINIFLLSFIPIGIWLLFWFFRAIMPGGVEGGGPTVAFIIPTVLYVCLQVWIAVRAFMS